MSLSGKGGGGVCGILELGLKSYGSSCGVKRHRGGEIIRGIEYVCYALGEVYLQYLLGRLLMEKLVLFQFSWYKRTEIDVDAEIPTLINAGGGVYGDGELVQFSSAATIGDSAFLPIV